MPIKGLRIFLAVKNKTLKKDGVQICVNQKCAYFKDFVPVFSSVNLLQNEIVTHIKFDVSNSSVNCREKIKNRISKKELAKPIPIKWTNIGTWLQF